MPECYKIRDTRTGLFSTGVNDTLPAFHCYSSTRSWDRYRYFKYWTRAGKTWNNLGKVKEHLGMLGASLPKQWEIVRVETIDNGMVSVSVVGPDETCRDPEPATVYLTSPTGTSGFAGSPKAAQPEQASVTS